MSVTSDRTSEHGSLIGILHLTFTMPSSLIPQLIPPISWSIACRLAVLLGYSLQAS